MSFIRRTPSYAKSLRHARCSLIFGIVLALGVTVYFPSPATADDAQGSSPRTTDEIRQYNIEGGSLDAVLNRFALEAGIELSVSSALTQGKTSGDLKGRYSATEGLRTILQGSGLHARFTGEAEVTVEEVTQDRDSVLTLDAVTVMARRPENENIVVRRSTGGALFGESDLMEIPFSVNIVGEAEIKNRQATSLSEMLATDPAIGFEYQDAGGQAFERLSVRGFTQANQVINGQLTGLDVIMAQSEAVDRIEVLRGPAAFRYGFVNPGGIVNVVTKRPTTRPQTSVSLLGVTDSQLGAHVDHSSHFDAAERFGYRVNAVYSDGDLPIDTQERERSLIALATDFKLTNDLTIYADLQYSKIKSRGGNSLFPIIRVATDGRALDPIDPRKTMQPAWNSSDVKSITSGLEIEYKLAPEWQLNSMFRYIDTEHGGYGGVTFNDPFQPNGDFVLGNYGYRNEYKGWSNVTFIQGNFNTGRVGHKLTTGISYLDTELDRFFAENNNMSRVSSNLYNPVMLAYSDPGAYLPGFELREEQSGVFISDELTIGRWRPLVGLRYSKLDYDATSNSRASSSSKVSPMLALSYDASDEVTLYGSFATGLENGGFAPAGTTNADAQMPPLETRGYEVGIKSDLLNGRATLDAALFSIEKTAAFTDSTNNTYVQKGKQVHNGIEVIAKGRFWRPLELSAGITYIDAELKDDPATDGNRPVNVPRLSAAFFGEYAVASVPGLYLSGLVNYRSGRDYNIPNRNQVPGYTVIGLGARYETKVKGYESTFRFNVDNVTDKSYYKMIDAFGGTLGAPRTVKASLEVRL